jgi:hypothetical protein
MKYWSDAVMRKSMSMSKSKDSEEASVNLMLV